MSDIDPLGQFSGVNSPGPMPPKAPLPPIPQPLRDQTVQPPTAAPPAQDTGGIINFFRSLFHRQTDLDDIMKQNGIRGEAVPAEGGIRG